MKRVSLSLSLLLLALTLPAVADVGEIKDNLSTASRFLDEQKYDKAIEELQWAIAEIQKLQGGSLATFLPEPEPGWTVEESEGDDVESAHAMGMSMVASSRHYSKGDATVTVTITGGDMARSLGGLAGMASAFGGSGDQDMVRINGERGILEFSDGSGTLTFTLEGVIVAVEGYGLDDAEILKAYAKKMDFEGLQAAAK